MRSEKEIKVNFIGVKKYALTYAYVSDYKKTFGFSAYFLPFIRRFREGSSKEGSKSDFVNS